MKLLLAKYNALRNLLAHIVHSNCEKDLTEMEVVDQFTGNALSTVLRAIEEIGETIEQQDEIRFSVIKKLDSLLKLKDIERQ